MAVAGFEVGNHCFGGEIAKGKFPRAQKIIGDDVFPGHGIMESLLLEIDRFCLCAGRLYRCRTNVSERQDGKKTECP